MDRSASSRLLAWYCAYCASGLVCEMMLAKSDCKAASSSPVMICNHNQSSLAVLKALTLPHLSQMSCLCVATVIGFLTLTKYRIPLYRTSEAVLVSICRRPAFAEDQHLQYKQEWSKWQGSTSGRQAAVVCQVRICRLLALDALQGMIQSADSSMLYL